MRFFETTRSIRRRNNRPRGTLPKADQLPLMMENIEEYVKQLSANQDVVGITLTGGLSRGYGDQLSEIDLNIYLREDRLQDWGRGRGPIPQGDHLGTKYHMDVSFLSLKAESTAVWDLLKKWNASYTKILYDPTGIVEKYLDSEDVFTAEEKHRLALSSYLDCVYYADIVVRQWILRDDPMVANQMINKAIPSLCNLLFLANDEYPPFEKWLINYSYSLQWTPVDWEKRLREITLIKEISSEEAERRSALFMGLYREIWERVVGIEYGSSGLIELDALESLRYVIENQPTMEEFTERFSEKQLGYEVLYKLTDIREKDDAKVIVFNTQKFIQEKSMDFPSFLDWNKEILRQIKLPQS